MQRRIGKTPGKSGAQVKTTPWAGSANTHPISVDWLTLNSQNAPDFIGPRPAEFVQVTEQLPKTQAELGYLIIRGQTLDLADDCCRADAPGEVEFRIDADWSERGESATFDEFAEEILYVHVSGRPPIDEIGVSRKYLLLIVWSKLVLLTFIWSAANRTAGCLNRVQRAGVHWNVVGIRTTRRGRYRIREPLPTGKCRKLR